MARAQDESSTTRSHGLLSAAERGIGAIAKLARMVQQLQAQLGRAEELADEITLELLALKHAAHLDASGQLARVSAEAATRARDTRRWTDTAAELQRASATGVRKVEFGAGTPRGELVRVDQGDWFELPKMPASLLRILARDAAPGCDGFRDWQPLDAVAAQLAQKTGKQLNRHAITQLLHRLRRLLSANRVNRFVLRADRRRGLRMLVR